MFTNNWVHSYEEDTENQVVFRPSTFNFPLRRGGRDGIDIKEDKTFIQRGDFPAGLANLGADDRYSNYLEGTWNLEGTEILTLENNAGAGALKLKVALIENNKLVFEK